MRPIHKVSDLESIRKNVNKFDKEYGVKLKTPIKLATTKEDYEDNLINYKATLTYLITSLNNIKLEKYVSREGIFNLLNVKEIKLNKKFTKKSFLFYNEIYVESNEFKLKFMTVFIKYIIDNLNDVAKILQHNGDRYTAAKDNKYMTRCYYIEDLISNISKYIRNVIMDVDGDDMSTMYFNELLLFIDKDGKSKKNISDIKNLTDHISIFKPRLFSKEDNVLLLSLISEVVLKVTKVNKNKTKIVKRITGTPKINSGVMCEILTDIGKDIVDNEMSTGFNLFIESDPVISVKLNKINDNNYLLIGILALKYYAFISNDLNINRRVNKLINILY